MSTANALIKYKGLGDVLVACILVFKPDVIYGSLPARLLASWTGLVGSIKFNSAFEQQFLTLLFNRAISTCPLQTQPLASTTPSHAW
jgi:hypothetical protein